MSKSLQKKPAPNLCREWRRISPAAYVVSEVLRLLKENPQMLGNSPQLQETLQTMQALDSDFEKTRGNFLHIEENAFDTARAFTDIHMERYRHMGRPSLPALAIHHAEHMELDKNSAVYKALIIVAVRAEMKAAASPEYHSKFHYMDVAAMTANLLEKNAEMARKNVPGVVVLTQHEQALTFIAAIGHDLDHPGTSNPAGKPLFNEMKSYGLMNPLLKKAGLSAADRRKIKTILKTTSPDGPHAVLKAAALAQRTGSIADFSKADPEHRFTELYALAHDSRLTQMAAIVSDSDLYASSGAGLKANRITSELFQKEKDHAGESVELRTDAARKFFLDDIVGREGYASYAGRAVAGESLEALRRGTERRLASKPHLS